MRARIERGERLVEQQQARLHQQRAADGDALALAAGELAGPALEQTADVEHRDDARKLGRIVRQPAHPAAVVEILARPSDAETAGLPGTHSRCGADAPARRCAAALIEQHVVVERRCGRDPGVTSPAIMLTIVVLPAPDGPNSAGHAVRRSRKRHAELKSPSRFCDVDAQHRHSPCSACRRGARSHSEAISAASAMTMATITSRNAAASPPGICV